MSWRDDLKSELATGQIITQNKLYTLIDNVPDPSPSGDMIYKGKIDSSEDLPTTGNINGDFYFVGSDTISIYNGTSFINFTISEKIDKVSTATTGNFATFTIGGNIQDSGTDSSNFATETEIEDLSSRVSSLEGRGGPLTAKDFGTSSPTQEDLTEYACQNIWGTGGTFTWNSDNPAASTYILGTTTHLASEIFNSTWVRNTNDNHRWTLTNTQDTDPKVFLWKDVGADTVAIATESTPGIVKGSVDISVDVSGSVTIPKLVSSMHFKGSIDDSSDLPTTDQTTGDFYFVGSDTISIWSGSSWSTFTKPAAMRIFIQETEPTSPQENDLWFW